MEEPKLIQSRLSLLGLTDCPGQLGSTSPPRGLQHQYQPKKGIDVKSLKLFQLSPKSSFKYSTFHGKNCHTQEISKEKNKRWKKLIYNNLPLYPDMKCQLDTVLLDFRLKKWQRRPHCLTRKQCCIGMDLYDNTVEKKQTSFTFRN